MFDRLYIFGKLNITSKGCVRILTMMLKLILLIIVNKMSITKLNTYEKTSGITFKIIP